jgi:hypothetical protein
MATIFTSGYFLGLDNQDKAVSYGKLYFYQAGTTIPVNSFSTSRKDATNTIPVVLSASGKADVFLDVGLYDVVLKDQYDVVVRTIENFEILGPSDGTYAYDCYSYATQAFNSKEESAVSASEAALALSELQSGAVEITFLTDGNSYDLGFVNDTFNTGFPTDLGGLI